VGAFLCVCVYLNFPVFPTEIEESTNSYFIVQKFIPWYLLENILINSRRILLGLLGPWKMMAVKFLRNVGDNYIATDRNDSEDPNALYMFMGQYCHAWLKHEVI
jgi:hypothetical protein